MIRQFYSLAMWLAQPLLRRKLQRRSKQEPGYGQFVNERFGHYDGPVPAHDGPTLWIHAVSLGETRAAAVLVAALREQLPRMRLLLTHGTATGRAEGLKLLGPGDLQSWQPWDTQGAVERFLTHFKPSLGILMETEVWPNLVAACQHMGVPLLLVNARLSDKSLHQAQRMAWLARPAFAALTSVWAQTASDAQRLLAIGAQVQGVSGNLKFDASPHADQLELGRRWRAQLATPVVMFASSREGEELALLHILKKFWPITLMDKAHAATNSIVNVANIKNVAGVAHVADAVNDVQWLIVPRHPQRFDAVVALIKSHGFAVQRRSNWGQGGPSASAVDAHANPAETSPVRTLPTIWLGDSLGEMALYYGLADVALLGGSFEPLGGQNLIEAAACGCPVVMGPHTFNFTEAAHQAEQLGAALRAPDMSKAITLAADLAVDAARLAVAMQAATTFAQSHRGATQALVKAIKQALTERT